LYRREECSKHYPCLWKAVIGRSQLEYPCRDFNARSLGQSAYRAIDFVFNNDLALFCSPEDITKKEMKQS
jgi:hypothetical protein